MMSQQKHQRAILLQMRTYCVYILSSKSRRIYIGVTGNLPARISAHRLREHGFTSLYRIDRLVFVETTTDVRAAISREKQLKGWTRAKKVALIESVNPTWDDLAVVWNIVAEKADPSLRSG